MKKVIRKTLNALPVLSAAGVMTLGATVSQAAIDLTGVSIDLTSWEAIMAMILPALGILAAGRKCVGSLNKF